MNARSVIVCVVFCAYFGVVFGQVGSLCRPKERLLQCGCPKTCRDPVPECKGVCKEGCFCEEGQVRNDEGICVNLADCPPIPQPYKLETSEPRVHGGVCREDEEYRFCEVCNRSCDNLNPVCPAQCMKGCFCKGDLLRDKDGKCVKYDQCSNIIEYIKEREKNVFAPMPYAYSCGTNQQYRKCQKCVQSCSDPEPVCGRCRTGCFCKEGLVKGPDGKCIKKEECPTGFTFVVAHFYTSIEDCSSDEDFYSCGLCEPSCQDPTPNCPDGCTSGCLCRPPTVRHASGLCVPREKCPAKCSDPNEEYSCLFGCERHCHSAGLGCQVKRYPLRCVLGCHCKKGLMRSAWNTCVEEAQCGYEVAIVVD